jgi:hypothetical protein
MTISPHEKLFTLFLHATFISRSSRCSSSSSSNSNNSSNNSVIFAAAVSIVINVILQVIDYDRHIFVHLLFSCADSVIGSCSCWVSKLK